MTSATCVETMIDENEQKKSLVFNLFKFGGGSNHPSVISFFAR
jgi:hypothetical protein